MKKVWEGFIKQAKALKAGAIVQCQENPLGVLLILLVVSLLAWIIRQTAQNNWLGFEGKRLWHWMDLLLVPVIVAFVVWILDRREHMSDRIAAKARVDHEQNLTNQRAATDRKINNDRLNQQTLESCLEYISEHILNAHVSPATPLVKTAIIRARVLEVIDSLGYDYQRRDQVLRFLYETDYHKTGAASQPLFREANLSKLKLRKADLRQVDFTKTDLTSANLCGSRLSEACFEDARLPVSRLIGVSLDKANLTRADLNKACLAKSSLVDSILNDAQLNDANLKCANLSGAEMKKARLDYANLKRANLSDAQLSGAVMKGANLHSVSLQRTVLNNADLRETDLGSAIIEVDINQADFVNLRGAKIDESTIMPKKLRDVLEIQGTPSIKKKPNISDEKRERSSEDSLLDLLVSESADLEVKRDQRYKDVDLSMSDLDDVYLSGFDLFRTDFTGSQLRGADFTKSKLHRTKFTNCDLTGAILDGAEMDECELTGATITQAQLARAKNVPPIFTT